MATNVPLSWIYTCVKEFYEIVKMVKYKPICLFISQIFVFCALQNKWSYFLHWVSFHLLVLYWIHFHLLYTNFFVYFTGLNFTISCTCFFLFTELDIEFHLDCLVFHWIKFSVTCSRLTVFSEYSGFLHQYNWPPRYKGNIVESGVKTQ